MRVLKSANKNGRAINANDLHSSTGFQVLPIGDDVHFFTVETGGAGGSEVGQGDAFMAQPPV